MGNARKGVQNQSKLVKRESIFNSVRRYTQTPTEGKQNHCVLTALRCIFWDFVSDESRVLLCVNQFDKRCIFQSKCQSKFSTVYVSIYSIVED